MSQFPNSKQIRFGHSDLVIGTYLGFGIWDLQFQIPFLCLINFDPRGSIHRIACQWIQIIPEQLIRV